MILSFDKPKKVRSTEEHNSMYQADSAPPGVYVPNMSQDDMQKWKAKHIKGQDERIEIRKSVSGAQMLIIVYKAPSNGDWVTGRQCHEQVQISANGKMQLTLKEWEDMQTAISEARIILGV